MESYDRSLLSRTLLPALLWLLAQLAPLPAFAAAPDPTPIPRLETGGHTAPIRRIAVDRAGRWLVTASDDKTARVWDLQTGELVQVLRPPIGGDAREGKLYAVAISPDGAMVAVGGWTQAGTDGFHFYLFDRTTGALRRALGGLPDIVNHLAWSPDGRRLAATLGNSGLRVYDTGDWHELYADKDYKELSLGADFAADGRLLTTSHDGLLRLYRPTGDSYVRAKPVRAPGGKQPYTVRFSPNGQRLAVGYADTPRVDVLDAASLALLPGYAATDGINSGHLASVAWSRDGRTLYAAGWYDDGSSKSPILLWPDGGRGSRTAMALATDTVMELVALTDGGLVFWAQGSLLCVLGADGQVRRYGGGQIADFRGRKTQLRVNYKGTLVEFGYDTADTDFNRRANTACFDLISRRLAADACTGGELYAPYTGIQPSRDWLDTTTPSFAGQSLTLWTNELSRSLAVTRRGFVLGADWHVYAFERNGTQRWRQPLPGTAWAVNVSGDGRYVVVAAGDGTLRWYADHGERAEEVLALYVHPDGKRWIAWTQHGFFDASGPDAEQLFGFHVNHGRDQAGEFVRASQLRERFLNPELIAHRLDVDGDERLAATLARLGDAGGALRNAPPPTLRLDGAVQIDAANGTARIPLRVEGKTAGNTALRYRVDGGAELQPREADASGGPGFVLLDLATGQHTVAITQANPQGTRSPPLEVPVTMPGRVRLPALHVLAIGISEYRDADLRDGVRFAAFDAAVVASKFAARARPLFTETHTRPLLDTDADRKSIEAGLQELASSVQPQDVLVLFLAGHGTADEADYYFVPQDAVQRNREELLKASLSGLRLRELLAAIPANKKLVLLDTCASGKFQLPGRSIDTKDAAESLARKSGLALLAAAGGDRYALEVTGHGAFTSALLEALDGKATSAADGTLSIDAIADYVSRRVPELTKQYFRVEQFPVRQFNNHSFPIATVRGSN